MLHAGEEDELPGSAALDAATINEEEFTALEEAAQAPRAVMGASTAWCCNQSWSALLVRLDTMWCTHALQPWEQDLQANCMKCGVTTTAIATCDPFLPR